MLSGLLSPPRVHGQTPLQPLGGEPPTLGVHLPVPSLVGGLDASGVEVSPAALGMLDSWALMVHHAELRSEGRTPGTGTAIFAGVPVPLLRSVVAGFGLQFLRPPSTIGYADTVKFSFGPSWRLSQHLSLGMVWHTFIAHGDPGFDGMNTFDVGLVLRPFEWLAGGLVVRDLFAPKYGDLPLQRRWDFELALRPFSSRRFELGLGATIGERRGELDPHARLEGEPLRGLSLFAGLQVLRRDFHRQGSDATDYRFSLGLGFHLEHVGLDVSTVAARSFDAGTGPLAAEPTRASFQGMEATLRLQGSRRAPLVDVQKLILHVELEGELDERGLANLATILRRAEERADVVGVLFELNGLSAGTASIQELRRWVKRLRHGGKKVYAFLRSARQREYYLAAACDRVLLDPAATLDLKGIALRGTYFRGTFDLLGVNPEFVRIAEFKSAPESYTRRGPSPEATQVARSLLDEIYGQLTGDLAKDRRRSPAEVRKLIDGGPYVPTAALTAGLVDELVESGDLKGAVSRGIGGGLVKAERLRRAPERWPVGPSIAVVVVDGDITSGKSVEIPLLGRRLEGDETINAVLAWARQSPSVKAVVLRVNSPGGSAWASDKMWRELMRLRERKPLVVSMGDVAASGGYYIASAGQTILAEPGTITGSIGIFSGKFDFSGLMRKLGINIETLASVGQRALIDSFDKPYTPDERRLVLSQLQYFYRLFLGAVAKGRRMTQDAVHAVARGRVWTGSQAKARGLVDREGGLMDALDEAKRLAKLPADRPVRILVLPEEKRGLLGRLIKMVTKADAGSEASPLPTVLKEALRGVMPSLLRARSNEPMARLPFQLDHLP